MSQSQIKAIIADVGGTHSRFAKLTADGAIITTMVFHNGNFSTFEEAVRSYLDRTGQMEIPREAAFCFACPIDGDRVALTNFGWDFTISGLRRRFSIARLEVINDCAAIALAVPRLGTDERTQIGGGAPAEHAPIAAIGPGTGLGVAGLVWSGERWIPLATEGGHVTMAASDDAEAAILAHLRANYGHISAERVVSGPGLESLYAAMAEMEGAPTQPLSADQIAEQSHENALCLKATRMFAALLGTAASDLALTLGARGGVYIGGGVVNKMGEAFDGAHFRARFEAKGRFEAYMASIPTYVITRPSPALLGLAALLDNAR